MGLARVVYDGVTLQSKGVKQLAEAVGITPEEAVEGVCLILDNWRRNRILFVSGDPIFSRYHAKDDPYIQAGLLPLREFRPEGLLLNADKANPYSRGLIAQRGVSAVQALFKKWTKHPNIFDADATTAILWEFLTHQAKVLHKVTLRSQRETPVLS
jgi:hypothetical protein